MKKVIIVLLILSIRIYAQYEFPQAYYPKGGHPRLWLTEERISALQQARTQNNTEWKKFYADVINTYMPASTSWVTNAGTAPGIPYAALMYRLTGNTDYAARALYFALNANTSYTSAERYWITDNMFMALGYDWLYDYMTQEQRDQYAQRIIALADNMWSDAHWSGDRLTYTSIDTDRNTIGVASYLMFGIALYGDYPDAAVKLLNRAWWLWTRGSGDLSSVHRSTHPRPVREFFRDAHGGIYYPGLAYYMGTDTKGLLQIWYTLKTSCGYDLSVQEPELVPIWRNLIRGVFDQTEPQRQKLFDSGDWQDQPVISDQPWINRFVYFLSFGAQMVGDSDWASLMLGYGDKIEGRFHDGFYELMFSLPDHQVSDPYTGGLPLVHAYKGVDYLFFRNSWNTSATYGSFSGQGGEPADHQSEDTGAFMLYREDDYLTKTASGYRDFNDAGFVFNNLSIDNGSKNGSPRVRDAFESKASMQRSRCHYEFPVFAYGMVEADGQWNLDPNDYAENRLIVSPISTYRRHFFWAGEYAVVLDRIRAKRSVNIKYRLRAQTIPSLQGNTITQLSENGKHKLLHRTLQPSGCNYTLLDEKTEWARDEAARTGYYNYQIHNDERRWQHLIQPPASDSYNMLNIMQMGPAAMTSFDVLQYINDSENCGVRIGDWAVVFSDKEELRDHLQYTITEPGVKINHLVADLKTGSYSVRINGGEIRSFSVNDEDNTGYFTTDALASGEQLFVEIVPEGQFPVELTAFTASLRDRNTIVLYWETATELNNYGFEIERRTDTDDNWKSLGFVPGHGSSSVSNRYSFEDQSVSANGMIHYRLKQVDLDGSIRYYAETEVENNIPADFSLKQNYPNPFNPATVIEYSIAREANVSLKLYDALGNRICELVNEVKTPGRYKYHLNASAMGLSSGIYFYSLTSGEYHRTIKMTLIK